MCRIAVWYIYIYIMSIYSHNCNLIPKITPITLKTMYRSSQLAPRVCTPEGKGRICCRLATTTRRPSVLTTQSRTRIGQECLKYPIILFPAFCCFLLLLYILLSPPPPQPFDQHRSSNTKHLIQRHLQSHYRPLQLHSFCPTSPLHCSTLLLAALRCCL